MDLNNEQFKLGCFVYDTIKNHGDDKQFKLGRLFAFMNNLKIDLGRDDYDDDVEYDIDVSIWIDKLIEGQERLEVFINDEILRQLIEILTENAVEIIYENQLYFNIDDLFIYVNNGLITIEDDYDKGVKISSAEEMGDFDEFEIEYVN